MTYIPEQTRYALELHLEDNQKKIRSGSEDSARSLCSLAQWSSAYLCSDLIGGIFNITQQL